MLPFRVPQKLAQLAFPHGLKRALRDAVASAASILPLAATLLIAVACPARATWKTFTTTDGLAGNLVRWIVEDDQETLWFATWAGLSRYDGVSWRTYTRADGLAGDSLNCALKASDGSLWFGAERGGVTRVKDGTLRTYTAASGIQTGTPVWSISEDRSGRIWFATMGSGAIWFDGVTWGKQPGLATEFIHCVFEDHEGTLWIGTHGDGIYRCAGTDCTQITKATSPIAGNDVLSITEDAQHRLWFATTTNVSSRDSLGSWKTYTASNGLSGSVVWKVIQDRAGFMWFGTIGYGVSRFDGRWWRRYSELAGYFSGSSVYSMTQDRSGNLWLATSAGAARFDGSELATFPDVSDLSTAIVLGVSQDRQGSLWFGTEYSGAFEFDGTTWTPWFPVTRTPFPMQDQAGNRWFPQFGTGLIRLDTQGQWKTFTTADGLASNYPRSLVEDRDHNLWVAHSGGVSRYDGTTWRAYTRANTGGGLAADDIYGILQDRDGSLWFGSYGGGVSRLDSLGNWRTFTTQDGLGGNFVLSLLQATDGYLWFTTPSAGVNRFLREPTPGGVERLTSAHGLRNDLVLGETQTRDGNLWFTLDQGGGVMRWDGTEWRGIGTEDGLPSGSCHLILEDSIGDLWITTNRGVARYGRDYVPPRTVLTQRPPGLSGSRSQSALFAALGESDRLEFSYRLDGGGWSGWSSINGWSAQNMPDGIHNLEVRSRDYWLNVDPTAEMISFEIDATTPLPAISAPSFGAPVQGVVQIHGVASDPRFRSFQVLARPSGAMSWESPVASLLNQSSAPVVNGVLASWQTTALPDGLYDIRVSVADSLGLVGVTQVSVVVDNFAPFVSVTSPAKVTAASGGDVFTTNAEVHLYFPPRAFREDAVVVVTPVAEASAAAAPAGGAALADPGYEISWSGGALRKPARLRISYAGLEELPSGVLAVYYSANGTDWERLGGTVDAKKRTIELAVERSGRYALYADEGARIGSPTLSGLSFTPRVFSPTGGYADREVGISFTLGRPGAVTVKVYNRAGRLVREVASGISLGAGVNVIRWDGTDRSGLVVPDGIYLVNVEAFGKAERLPLAVVR